MDFLLFIAAYLRAELIFGEPITPATVGEAEAAFTSLFLRS